MENWNSANKDIFSLFSPVSPGKETDQEPADDRISATPGQQPQAEPAEQPRRPPPPSRSVPTDGPTGSAAAR